MSHLSYSRLVPWLMLVLAGQVSAMGLGEIKGNAVLGESVRLEVELLGAGKQHLDASCFRLIEPASGTALPWLKKASLSVRNGPTPVLEIRSTAPLREPIMLLVVQMGCGHEFSRSYTLVASPAGDTSVAPPLPEAVLEETKPARVASAGGGKIRRSQPAATAETAKTGQGAEQRAEEIERQAASVQATEEKLRAVESRLGELQQHAAQLAERVEQEAVPALVAAQQKAAQVDAAPAEPIPDRKPVGADATANESEGFSGWSLIGILLGALLGVAGWLGWHRYQQSSAAVNADDTGEPVPDVVVDPRRVDEREELGGVDLLIEPVAMGAMAIPEGATAESEMPSAAPSGMGKPAKVQSPAGDSVFAVGATTVDEHFAANPVMELAEIMLSFGRVKGAAQALQEYIDSSPQEALQPWIRLLDVYRMANMREEFETLARNLNQHFNVEVQSWEGDRPTSGVSLAGAPLPVAPKPLGLEDVPRLMNAVVDQWQQGDVVGYLYQLLRDNRGGQRQGFNLQVVDDILFLIELKETANRMEKN